jgi:hypothetical protein
MPLVLFEPVVFCLYPRLLVVVWLIDQPAAVCDP